MGGEPGVKGLHLLYDIPEAGVRQCLTLQEVGTRSVYQTIGYYNPGMIPAIGYRVHVHHGTRSCRWATEHIREYLINRFVPDYERLNDNQNDHPGNN